MVYANVKLVQLLVSCCQYLTYDQPTILTSSGLVKQDNWKAYNSLTCAAF
jgi:hypothetical protein